MDVLLVQYHFGGSPTASGSPWDGRACSQPDADVDVAEVAGGGVAPVLEVAERHVVTRCANAYVRDAATPRMDVRDATTDDAELLATEFWYPLAKRMEQYSPLNELRDGVAEDAVDAFEAMLQRDDRRIFLREVDDDAVAFLVVELGERPSREHGRYADIVDLYVKDAHRGRGHGTALVEHVEALADRENRDYLTVSAEWANEPAREFYRKHDYEPKQITFAKPLD